MNNLWRDERRKASGIDSSSTALAADRRDPALVVWGGGHLDQQTSRFSRRTVRVMRIRKRVDSKRSRRGTSRPAARRPRAAVRSKAMTDDEMVVSRALPDGAGSPAVARDAAHASCRTRTSTIPTPTPSWADQYIDGRRHAESVFGAEAVWIPPPYPGRFVCARGRRRSDGIRRRARWSSRSTVCSPGASARESYEATIEMNSRAEEYAAIRAPARSVGTIAPPPRSLSSGKTRRAAGSPVFARLSPRAWQGGSPRRGMARPVRGGRSRVVLATTTPAHLEFVGGRGGPRALSVGLPRRIICFHQAAPLFVQEPRWILTSVRDRP